MIKKIVIGCFIISNIIFGKINDYRNILTEENKLKIENAIQEFEKKTNTKIYLNTLEENEGFESVDQEKTIIINIVKNLEDKTQKIKVQLKISQDLQPEEFTQDLELLLDSVKDVAVDGNETELSISIIDGLGDIFAEDVDTDADEDVENDESSSVGQKIFFGILLTFFLLFIRILQVKRKKRKYYERRKKLKKKK